MTVRLHRARRRLGKSLAAIDNDVLAAVISTPVRVQKIGQEAP
jgi:hypothetical protein